MHIKSQLKKNNYLLQIDYFSLFASDSQGPKVQLQLCIP